MYVVEIQSIKVTIAQVTNTSVYKYKVGNIGCDYVRYLNDSWNIVEIVFCFFL